MSKATVTCVCRVCGASFTKSKTCYNRAEADRWEAWAVDHFDLCPDCYASSLTSEKDQKLADFAASHPLPTITGASEKQISYAASLRRDYILARLPEYLSLEAEIAKRSPEELAALYIHYNFGPADTPIDIITDKIFACFSMDKVRALFKLTSAREIIDLLRNN